MITSELDTSYWQAYDSVEKLNSAYSNWLVKKIKFNGFENYTGLLNMLCMHPFVWSVYNDDNRESDGLELRNVFATERFIDQGNLVNGQCSFLEVLVGLALRMDGILLDYNHPSDPGRWFLEMLTNSGLIQYTNDELSTKKGKNACTSTMDYILFRCYDSKGKGGLFPLNGMCSDQRKVELWYQMSSYILENYNIVSSTDYKNL